MEAAERPSDLRNASASPGAAEATAALPRDAALGFLPLFAAFVESGDLMPIDEAAKEGPWLLLSATARVRMVDCFGGDGVRAPPALPADFGTPAAEKRAIDARIVGGARYRTEEARRRESDVAAAGGRREEGRKGGFGFDIAVKKNR